LPEVKQCAATVEKDKNGVSRLVAFVMGDAVDKEKIQEALLAQLPVYMVPSILIVLDQLPLTSNGKVDKKALSTIVDHNWAARKLVAPSNETEAWLCGLWQELLGVEQVSIHDNFFELGGHSLLATRAVSAIKSNFQIDIGVSKLFELTDVASVAQHVEALRNNVLDGSKVYTQIAL
ncbi:MAG TPA: phosphopantetheine-binding protein, partial [Hymenobacter sp.]|nr:phosphopantetheine-binding protein [Hymenobacter sp.]